MHDVYGAEFGDGCWTCPRESGGKSLTFWDESCVDFFFNDTATTEIYTLSLHDALPIYIPIYENSVIPLPEGTEIAVSSILRNFVYQILDFGPDVNQAHIMRGKIRSNPSLHSFLEDSGHKEDGYFIHGEHSLTAVDVAKFNPEIMIDEEREMAFEAAYGYLDGYCWKKDENAAGWYERACRGQLNIPIGDLLDFSFFQGPSRLKCYECHQFYFVEFLERIIDGVEYGDIPGLLDFLNLSIGWMSHRVVLEEKQFMWEPLWRNPFREWGQLEHGRDANFPYKHIFNDFFMSLVSNFRVFNVNSGTKRKKGTSCNLPFFQ